MPPNPIQCNQISAISYNGQQHRKKIVNHPFLWFFPVLLFYAESANPYSVVSSITDAWKLAAFALAVMMFLILRTRHRRIPLAAWIVISMLVTIPVIASVYQGLAQARLESKAVYRVRITVIDPQQTPVDGAKVWSSVGGEAHTVAGGAQFVIPAATVPQDRKVTIYAKHENTSLTGKAEMHLGDDYNPAITIQLYRVEVMVRGQVVDIHRRAIPGAIVSVVGYGKEAVTTQLDGNFELPAHAAINQHVQLHAEKPGYKAVNQWHPAGNYPTTLILEK
jgi:hypothetical protein